METRHSAGGRAFGREFSAFVICNRHLIPPICRRYTILYPIINPTSATDLQRLSDCAEAVTNWHLLNGLLLNPSRTEALVTNTRQQVAKFESTVGISLADTTVKISTDDRILSITLDKHLTFNEHINKV